MLKNIVIALCSLIVPLHMSLVAVFILVVSDAITGIAASIKKGEQFQSSKLFNSILKLFVYQMLIIVAAIIQHYLMNDLIPLTNWLLMFIATVEFSSLAENATVLTGRDIVSYVKDLFKRLKK